VKKVLIHKRGLILSHVQDWGYLKMGQTQNDAFEKQKTKEKTNILP